MVDLPELVLLLFDPKPPKPVPCWLLLFCPKPNDDIFADGYRQCIPQGEFRRMIRLKGGTNVVNHLFESKVVVTRCGATQRC